ncbi:MAG: tetraacyldisaccharide 4'-kinase [Thermohalobaculum sp.]|nr:tetraacyldisaccharide 4'-kinase [Thermohalobaculum sp.]
MRAPAFWWAAPGAPGWRALLLAPLAWAWGIGAALRARARPADPGVAVVCVGNLTAGGAGKTPMVGALTRRLQARGIAPHVLLRGHGGRIRGPHMVDPARDTAADVGDEALIHASLAPTWVARDRLAGARAAAAAGAPVVLMDDGFQNPRLRKAVSILVVDAGQGFGNGRLIPAGPLREPVAAGLARADLVVLVGPPPARAAALSRWPALAAAAPLGAILRPVPTGLPLSGEPVVAFAGIGRPAKFFATLRELGARLVAAEAFPDHHRFDARVLTRLLRLARGQGAMLVTTEKDAVRLPPAFRREVVVVQVALAPDDWAPLDAVLDALGLG